MDKIARRLAVVAVMLVAALALAACGGDDESSTTSGGTSTSGASAETQDVTLLMNWFAQAEQGGYWQADAEDLGSDEGIDIHVEQGGPQIQTIPQVASGKAEFGVAQADELLLARAEGVPVVEVFGGMDRYLQCMMFHPNQGISDWPDLNGHDIAVAPSGGFWPYIKGKYHLDDVKEINFTGSLAEFQRNEGLVQQCFITSEPYVAKEQGIDIETMMVADSGYNPYSQGLFTTEKVIKENPDLVRKVVAAAQQGWKNFLSDPSAGKQLILDTNKDMEPGAIDYAQKELADGDYFASDLGSMTEERWQTMADQLREAGVLTKDVDVDAVWTDEFLPKQ
ncbi:MAG TPA: ABC transporter substrate-binding protein [Capillimicrobium sp.]|nr:ABC transporter substrate-binding protein [Capillimicrobium sp.]